MNRLLKNLLTTFTILTGAVVGTMVYAAVPTTSPTTPVEIIECLTVQELHSQFNTSGGIDYFIFTPEELKLTTPDTVNTVAVYTDFESVVLVPVDTAGCVLVNLPPIVDTLENFLSRTGVVIARK